MKSYNSPKTTKKLSSKIHGVGLFAKENIKKDEVIAIKAGHILTLEDLKKLPYEGQHPELQITENLFIGPTNDKEYKETMVYINHSCNPNIGMMGNIVAVAIRDIKSGEELTQDYATVDCREYSFSCTCGSKNCRKTINGNDWQIPEIQNRLMDYFSSYIQQKIRVTKNNKI